jgi:hypothetical protein
MQVETCRQWRFATQPATTTTPAETAPQTKSRQLPPQLLHQPHLPIRLVQHTCPEIVHHSAHSHEELSAITPTISTPYTQRSYTRQTNSYYAQSNLFEAWLISFPDAGDDWITILFQLITSVPLLLRPLSNFALTSQIPPAIDSLMLLMPHQLSS